MAQIDYRQVAAPTYITPANTSFSGITVSLTAGETLAFGDIVVVKTDGKAWKADANASGLFPAIGMALASATANNSVSVGLNGIARNDAWAWTVASKLFLSTTAGAMTHTAPSATGDCVQVLGTAVSATLIFLDIQQTWLIHS